MTGAPAAPDEPAILAYPGDIQAETGGYRYDRRVLAALGRRGVALRPVSLGDCRPGAPAESIADGGAALVALPGRSPVVVDGLALGVIPDAAAATAARRPLVALVHHPLAEETGLSEDAAAALRACERAALAHARRVVVTSPATARSLVADYDVPADRIAVAPPGVDRRPAARPDADAPHRLLAVGALVPRKGYDTLIEAVARLGDRPIRLAIAGDPGRDPAHAAALRERIAALGLDERIRLAGRLDEAALDALFARADLFVVASHHEGYGMAVAEAIACGLPVVGTDGGALAETIPEDVGRIVPAGDPDAFAGAIAAVLAPDELARRAAAARAHEARLPTWDGAAAVLEATLATVRSGARAGSDGA